MAEIIDFENFKKKTGKNKPEKTDIFNYKNEDGESMAEVIKIQDVKNSRDSEALKEVLSLLERRLKELEEIEALNFNQLQPLIGKSEASEMDKYLDVVLEAQHKKRVIGEDIKDIRERIKLLDSDSGEGYK